VYNHIVPDVTGRKSQLGFVSFTFRFGILLRSFGPLEIDTLIYKQSTMTSDFQLSGVLRTDPPEIPIASILGIR